MNENNKNVFNEELSLCSDNPVTGFFRDGCCNTDSTDYGEHLICSVMTDDFLAFSKQKGNDLSTPVPEFNFPGLKEGDNWCLCADRWREAYKNGCAPKIYLLSTNSKILKKIPLDILKPFAIDLD